MNLHCNSLRKNLRRSFARFQQQTVGERTSPETYFFLALAGAALPDGLAGSFVAAGLAAALASTLAARALPCVLSPDFPFLSLPLLSLGFGASLMPDSLRRIFSRSSGVLPLPFNCMAKIFSTTPPNFGPARIPLPRN